MNRYKYLITRRLEIDSGHRLMKHESKCANYHGHRYAFEVTVTADGLDDVGRVIDFSKIKELFGGWLDKNWDHAMLLEMEDPCLSSMVNMGTRVFVTDGPPTAENLSFWAFNIAGMCLRGTGITVVRMRVYETPNCWADYPGARQ